MIALMIPIVAVGGFFAWMISLSPVGKAWAERLRHGVVPPPGAAASPEAQEEMQEALDQLRREVAELAERVDFTERLLGQQRGSERLGPPRP
ncbi:MAG TPA: hypothetical protein VGQ06_16300 [Gemmatimonadales bacterium]|jgi:hypothetical protein|nr:hypothetical protein [Gemmatimonadales bacterium]